MNNFKLSRTSKSRLVGVNPVLAYIVTEAIKISNVDFFVADGVRSMKKQREYVKKGVSWTFKSKHLSGNAVDLVPYVNGKAVWTNYEGYFNEIAIAMKTVISALNADVEWGYDLWDKDMPHWQLTDGAKDWDIRNIKWKLQRK